MYCQELELSVTIWIVDINVFLCMGRSLYYHIMALLKKESKRIPIVGLLKLLSE